MVYASLKRVLHVFVAAALSSLSTVALARDIGWHDRIESRIEALALLQSLNADLLSHDSATLTLDRWCRAHRLASSPLIVADLIRNDTKAATEEQRAVLGVSPDVPVNYRHVRLRCGDRVLSEAENWYVPSRLTPEMNRSLETSDIAFGRAVKALRFQRHTLSAELSWSPLPEGWEIGAALPMESDGPLPVPDHVIRHRAVLILPDGTPFSEVIENYTSDVLAIPEPHLSSTQATSPIIPAK
jgi:chorismate-pyruvate lyase